MNDELSNLVDKKIRQLERYNEITSRIIYEDIDGVGDLLDKRQKLITAIDGVSVEIKSYVNSQSVEHQTVLKKMLKFEDIGSISDELIELQKKINKTKMLIDEINQNDKKAIDRITTMRDNVVKEMTESQKNKRVIDYFATTNVNVNKGSKLNISN